MSAVLRDKGTTLRATAFFVALELNLIYKANTNVNAMRSMHTQPLGL
jgi:hypothetical protein